MPETMFGARSFLGVAVCCCCAFFVEANVPRAVGFTEPQRMLRGTFNQLEADVIHNLDIIFMPFMFVIFFAFHPPCLGSVFCSAVGVRTVRRDAHQTTSRITSKGGCC